MNQLRDAFTLFLSLLVEAFPFLLLGVIVSSLLLLFTNQEQWLRRIPRHPILGAFLGSLIGFFFPVCECGNVPVARRFLLQGLPTSLVVGFLLAAPTLNPIVIWSTWIAFRDQPEIVWLRVLFSWLIAAIIACIFSVQRDPRPLVHPNLAKRLTLFRGIISPWQEGKCPSASPKGQKATSPLLQKGTFLLGQGGQIEQLEKPVSLGSLSAQPLRDFVENVTQELRELGGMLVIGSAIAAFIQVFIPRDFIFHLGQGNISSILAMMLLAGVVSICSTVDAFFALSFASLFTSASLLAFLVFGPMIDLKGMGLMLSIFKPRIIIYLFLLAAQLTFIFTLAYSYFF